LIITNNVHTIKHNITNSYFLTYNSKWLTTWHHPETPNWASRYKTFE